MMNLYEQKAFKKTFDKAKIIVKETKKDHVIIFIPNRISSERFQIFEAEKFFNRNIKKDSMMCYLSHP